jgi:hypothetical protein
MSMMYTTTTQAICIDCGLPLAWNKGRKPIRCRACASAHTLNYNRIHYNATKNASGYESYIVINDPGEYPIAAGAKLNKEEIRGMKLYHSFTLGTILENHSGKRFIVVERGGKQELEAQMQEGR